MTKAVAKSPSEPKKKLRPSKVKSLDKYEKKKVAKKAGGIPKKKPKKSLMSGTATWKVVYKSGTWRFIHKPTEDKLMAKAKAEGKPIETPVWITYSHLKLFIYFLFICYCLLIVLICIEKEKVNHC